MVKINRDDLLLEIHAALFDAAVGTTEPKPGGRKNKEAMLLASHVFQT